MRALLTGTVVDLDENPWVMNGKSGTTLKAFVQSGSPREAAVPVRVSERQFGAIEVGQHVLWPIDIQVRANDSGGAPKMVVRLPEEHDPKTDADTFVSSSAASI